MIRFSGSRPPGKGQVEGQVVVPGSREPGTPVDGTEVREVPSFQSFADDPDFSQALRFDLEMGHGRKEDQENADPAKAVEHYLKYLEKDGISGSTIRIERKPDGLDLVLRDDRASLGKRSPNLVVWCAPDRPTPCRRESQAREPGDPGNPGPGPRSATRRRRSRGLS